MATLSVNIDHVATVRQARRALEPDPVHAAVLCELAGAHGVTCHLREDRRHINDRDFELLMQTVKSKVNLEMACTKEMVGIALKFKPPQVTLVPEKRAELTTEGGLNVAAIVSEITDSVKAMRDAGIVVSMFIDPDEKQIEASAKIKADYIEIHTGVYASSSGKALAVELDKIRKAAAYAKSLGLGVNAGHGLNYLNTAAVAAIEGMEELNIGHSIISRAVFVGLDTAVRDMLRLIHG
ncbi:MAG: pyridoxine 5'-phosphate synthase [Fibrobacteres bacterium]|nr:pyridoxine 5'-phosphate synthase [Fibrobacterota bacterium]